VRGNADLAGPQRTSYDLTARVNLRFDLEDNPTSSGADADLAAIERGTEDVPGGVDSNAIVQEKPFVASTGEAMANALRPCAVCVRRQFEDDAMTLGDATARRRRDRSYRRGCPRRRS
jgi:hypothetical protein